VQPAQISTNRQLSQAGAIEQAPPPAGRLPLRYCATFKADPADYKPLSKTGGGYWFQERLHASAASSQPFLGTSTYRWAA
jgi:hypothetical protein